MEKLIVDENAIMKRYKLRKSGGGGTFVITLPKIAVEREARRLGISEEEAAEKLQGCWHFNNFEGLLLVFEIKGAK